MVRGLEFHEILRLTILRSFYHPYLLRLLRLLLVVVLLLLGHGGPSVRPLVTDDGCDDGHKPCGQSNGLQGKVGVAVYGCCCRIRLF